jgi:hypothetical protein
MRRVTRARHRLAKFSATTRSRTISQPSLASEAALIEFIKARGNTKPTLLI